MTLTLKIESHFVAWHSGSWWCTTIPSLVTKGSIQTLSKYVSGALHPSPLRTPQCFPFCSKIIHHKQCKKRSDIAATSQLMWTGMLGLVESQWYKQKLFFCVLARYTKQDTTSTTPEEMTVIYFVSTLMSSDKH